LDNEDLAKIYTSYLVLNKDYNLKFLAKSLFQQGHSAP